MLNEFLKIASY